MPQHDIEIVPDVLDAVESNVVARPAHLALWDETGPVSYAELWTRVAATAAGLTALGAGPGERVALHLANSADFVVSALAALYAGAVFVPVPFGDPSERVAGIVVDAAPVAVLAQPKVAAAAGAALGPLVVSPEDVRRPDLAAERCRDGFRPAYCIYTSGSTGTPKGVVIRHDSLATAVAHTAGPFGFHPGTKALCSSPFHFDGSFGSLFSVLVAGGALVIPNRDRLLLPRNFVDAVTRHGITHCTFSPSFLRMLVATPDVERLRGSALRTVGLGGEDCSAEDIAALRALVPQVRVFNRYGPTESTIAVSTYEITDDALRTKPKIPIGQPHDGTVFRLVDEDGCIIEGNGPVGELCIGGPQLMEGYWGDDALTQASLVHGIEPGTALYRTGDLVRRDEDGDYVYVDRRDSVVNRNGIRLGLTEVAAVLRSLPQVVDAACIADTATGNVRLSAFVTVDGPANVRELRAHLLRRVPAYMNPDDLLIVDALPMLSAGKPDARALRRLLDDRLTAIR